MDTRPTTVPAGGGGRGHGGGDRRLHQRAGRGRPGPDRPGAFRAAAAGVPLALWGAWMVAYAAAYGIAWPPELWAGVLGMASLSGLGLSLLALPPAVPEAAWNPLPKA